MEPSDRKIVTRSPSRTVRIINLPTLLPVPVEAESSLEADFVQRAALISSIATLIAQPFRLPVSPRGYTPDYLVTFSGNNIKAVVEIKIANKVERYKPLFDRVATFLQENGYIFYVATEKVLRHKNVDQRISRILRYTKAWYPQGDCARVEHALGDYPDGLPIGTLLRKAGVSRELILHLIARRRLTTGMRCLIDDSAVINRCDRQVTNGKNPLELALGIARWDDGSESRATPTKSKQPFEER